MNNFYENELDNLLSRVVVEGNGYNYQKARDNYRIVLIGLKALEILATNEISVYYLMSSASYEEYIDKCDIMRSLTYITKEQYDLLKAVLKNYEH